MSTDRELKEMLERIAKKVENSPVLNGGWDRMVVTIDHIKEKQDETSDKVDKIHEALYQPDTGFFARVAEIEHDTSSIKTSFEEHTKEDAKFEEKFEEAVNESKPAIQMVKRLEAIGGENLEEIQSAIKIKKTIDKMFWMIVVGGGSLFAKVAYDIAANYLHLLH